MNYFTFLRKISLLALLVANGANAYELVTHGLITQAAYSRSVLADPQLLQDLGIDGNVSSAFGEIYIDVSGTQVKERTQTDFEKSKMPDKGADFLKVNGWLLRGAIREDDVMIGFGGAQPQDDPYHPYVGFFRVFNHFYDPVHQAPLNIGGVPVGTITCGTSLLTFPLLRDPLLATIGCQPTEIAPQWAIGSQDVVNSPSLLTYAMRIGRPPFARWAMSCSCKTWRSRSIGGITSPRYVFANRGEIMFGLA